MLCMQETKIPSIVELQNVDHRYMSFQRHLRICKPCRIEFERQKKRLVSIERKIPVAKMDQETSVSFQNEIREILKSGETLDKIRFKKPNLLKDFLSALVSKRMFFAYTLSGIIFLAFKFF